MLSNLFQEVFFQFFGFFDSIELGLYFVICGYYFLIFAYFLFMRFRVNRKLYWMFFSVLFIVLAASRVFFIVYEFYIPELEGSISNDNLVATLMVYYRLATFSTWLATTSLMGILGILLFPPEAEIEPTKLEKKDNLILDFLIQHRKYVKYLFRILLMAFPIILGILALVLPDTLLIDPKFITEYGISIDPVVIAIGDWSYPIGRFVFNFVFQPLFVAIIPFIFFYLAWKTFGVLRKSYMLNAIGFLIYYVGRILKGLFDAIGWIHVGSVVPPLLILLSLLLIVIGNSYEALK